MSHMLEIENLQVFYGGIHALHNVSMHVDQGEIVSIIGANGAGKSTLMRSIAGDKEYKEGTIRFMGQALPKVSHAVVAKGVSLVPEGRRIFPNLTVRENLNVGAYGRTDGKQAVREDFEEVLALFPRLRERINQMSGTLSGGEQQMLAVGRALMARPKILCLDEPSLGLAPIIIDEMFDKLLELNRDRKQTILIVEQNAYLALDVSHRAYIIKTGEIVREGAASELLEDPSVQAEYLGAE